MAINQNPAMTLNCPNYSGLLYTKGNTATPLLSIIGSRRRIVPSTRFVTGQAFSLPEAKIPAISEAASMVAPEATTITRGQDHNVTQIFQEAVAVSYAKESHMGQLSGVNNAGQVANPASELDFQIAQKMRIIRQDIEKTFVNGKYHEAASDADANQTRGLVEAISSNVIDLGGRALSLWDIAELLVYMTENGAVKNGLVLLCDTVTKFQLAKEADEKGVRLADVSSVYGINVTRVYTPAGEVDLLEGRFLPVGTALVLNLGVVSPVENSTPGKGNFFYEELSKVGAGTRGQLFGQIGLDYGPEFFHGKLTGIAPQFERPGRGITVNVPEAVKTVEVLPELESVNITNTSVNKIAVECTYVGIPTSDPTLTEKYAVAAAPNGKYTDVEKSALTDYVGQFVKVQVTASGTATGVQTSTARKLTAAED